MWLHWSHTRVNLLPFTVDIGFLWPGYGRLLVGFLLLEQAHKFIIVRLLRRLIELAGDEQVVKFLFGHYVLLTTFSGAGGGIGWPLASCLRMGTAVLPHWTTHVCRWWS